MDYSPTPTDRLISAMTAIRSDIESRFVTAPSVPVQSWQSVKAPQPMPEILNYSFALDLCGIVELGPYQTAIRPNLPWADDHFVSERISGHPLNPGTQWRKWPYALSADRHRRDGEEDPQFDHSYAERYWPKYAGRTKGGLLGSEIAGNPRKGIRFPYGDLSDLLKLLQQDPLTRQAYLPVWFPEDLAAAVESKRVPCTLGYHFILREGKFHVVYPMRSCDYIRHFADDVYLTIRLLLAILAIVKTRVGRSPWTEALPGTLTMHITSLHLFEQDRVNLILGKRPQGVHRKPVDAPLNPDEGVPV